MCGSTRACGKARDAQFGYTVPNLQIEYAMRNTTCPSAPGRGSTPTERRVPRMLHGGGARAAGRDSLNSAASS